MPAPVRSNRVVLLQTSTNVDHTKIDINCMSPRFDNTRLSQAALFGCTFLLVQTVAFEHSLLIIGWGTMHR